MAKAALSRTTSTGVKLILAGDQQIPLALLLCMDRAIGHDWNHNLSWRDGDDIRRGRWTYYQYLRVGRCTQCGSERIEVFETDTANTTYDKIRNRYAYSELFRNRPRLQQGEIRRLLREYDLAS